MTLSFSSWKKPSVRRRSQRSSGLGGSLDLYESRTLLSGVAIYPQPAAAVEVAPQAAPPGNFAGTWNMSTPEGDGTAVIKQEGKFLEIGVDAMGEHVDFKGKVNGDTAKAKFNFVISGFHIKGKLTTALTGPDSMAGTAKVTVVGVAKATLPLTGNRVV